MNSGALLVFAAAASLLACAAEPDLRSSTRDVLPNGATLVRYADLPAIDFVGPAVVEARVELEFGSFDGEDPNLLFGYVAGIQAASDGTIYVLDQQAGEVRVFDSSGSYLRTIVRRGDGPGEIGDANGILLSGDTLLWIHDVRKWAVIGVDPAGAELRRFAKPVMSAPPAWDGVFDKQGRYWRETTHGDGGPGYPPPPGLSSWSERRYYKSYELATGAVDSIYMGEVVFRVFAFLSNPGGWGFMPFRFETAELIEVHPSGGFWRAFNTSYRAVRTNEGGDTLVVVEACGLPAEPVTAEDRASYVDGIVERRPDWRRPAEDAAALMPDFKPVIESLFVDDEGRLWVQRVAPEDEPRFYDRFSAEGDYLGSVRLAFEADGPIWVQHGNIYARTVDEFGVQYVARAPISG